ncbi:hypothetical protein DUNSADRAFT_17262 [Dunaliella salina]|uniref:Encoded protein n=1 Tax=Dunaliella salina TaxID=3046 RepID=A0ABQ7H0B0_DUNSA|nr:hypothetical protein DUNSADRAFT_17262 [Dunaliella salina]|eukprot:KAF5840293.1 hypothetical protein DUNSADRAFT_17262 [Dunaliella salina]
MHEPLYCAHAHEPICFRHNCLKGCCPSCREHFPLTLPAIKAYPSCKPVRGGLAFSQAFSIPVMTHKSS